MCLRESERRRREYVHFRIVVGSRDDGSCRPLLTLLSSEVPTLRLQSDRVLKSREPVGGLQQ